MKCLLLILAGIISLSKDEWTGKHAKQGQAHLEDGRTCLNIKEIILLSELHFNDIKTKMY